MRKLPNGRFRARLRVGTRGSVQVFEAQARTAKEALERARAKRDAAARDRELADASAWTVADWLRWWVDVELAERVADGTLAATTRRSYAQHVRLYLAPRLERAQLAGFDAVAVRRLMTQLREAGLSAVYRDKLHTTLKAAMATAVRYGVRVDNPVQHVAPPKVTRSRKQPVALEHVQGVLHGAKGTRLEALWRLLLSAPMRPGEPLALGWSGGGDELDLDAAAYPMSRNLVRVDGRWLFHDLKGHRARTVPLPPATVEALRAHRVRMAAERLAIGTGWQGAEVVDFDGKVVRPWLVFCYEDGQPIHQTWLQRELARVCEAGGVPRLTPYQLRHAAVTLLTAQGVHPRVVQQMAGHTDLSVTDLYVGRLDVEMREAATLLASLLDG